MAYLTVNISSRDQDEKWGVHNYVVPDQKFSLFHYSNPPKYVIFLVKGNKNKHFPKTRFLLFLFIIHFRPPGFQRALRLLKLCNAVITLIYLMNIYLANFRLDWY